MFKSKYSFQQWLGAFRPWSLTASGVPVCLGAALAAADGAWNFPLFALTLLGGFLLQIGTNLSNTYGDFISGVDTVDSATTVPHIVQGQMEAEDIRRAGFIAFGLAGLVTLVLMAFCGPAIAIFGLIGILGGYLYTNKLPYKYYGIGPLMVAILMGPLMVVPAYFIQTGVFTPGPALASLSISCLVSNIMHANDMRDMEHDRNAKIRTVAICLGLPGSAALYAMLASSAFAFAFLNILSGVLPASCILVFILLPKLGRELAAMLAGQYNYTPLEGWSGQFHMAFGSLLTIGVLLHIITGLVLEWL